MQTLKTANVKYYQIIARKVLLIEVTSTSHRCVYGVTCLDIFYTWQDKEHYIENEWSQNQPL